MSNNQYNTNEYADVIKYVDTFMDAYNYSIDKCPDECPAAENPLKNPELRSAIREALKNFDTDAYEEAMQAGKLSVFEHNHETLFDPHIGPNIAASMVKTNDVTYNNHISQALDDFVKRTTLDYLKDNNASEDMVNYFKEALGKLPTDFRSMTRDEIEAHATETAHEYVSKFEKTNEKDSSIIMD